MDADTEKNIQEQYSQKTTFRDKFKVAWNFSARRIIQNYDGIIKSVNQSMIWREIGNKEYTTAKNKDYLRKSIEAYTKSIAFAPVVSQELSLAYANRSAVLFRARLYEDCLLDIERSLKAGYPNKLRTKLYVRQALCFKALGSELEANAMDNAMQWLPNLKKYNPTYDLTKEYPKMINDLKEPRKIIKLIPEIIDKNAIIDGASDSIELKQTNENNQHVVATKDIESGEFIYISEPFAATPSDDLRFTNCWHCCRQTWAGIPCDLCSAIIYCSGVCKNKAWYSYHKMECSVSEHYLKFDKIRPGCSPAIKLFSKTLISVRGLIKLKKKIDNMDSMKNKKLIFVDGSLDVNAIHNFFSLDYFNATPSECSYEFASFVVMIVAIFAQKTKVLDKKMTKEDLIEYKNENLFIMGELLLRYLLIDFRHGQSVFVDDSVNWSKVMLPFSKILKPSCDPNVNWTHVDSNVGYYATKPIKQGEQIFSTRFAHYHKTRKDHRRAKLAEFYGPLVSCKCRACVENWPVLEDLQCHYSNESIPTPIEERWRFMMCQLSELENIIEQRDPKKFLIVKDCLNNMNDLLHESITGPCQEISKLYLLLEKLYSRLHSVHEIDE